jgi:23S rRNA pseudouridine1911/1915/1917 synthase
MQKTYFAIVQGQPKEDKAYLKHYLLKNMKTNTVSVVPPLTTNAKMAELEYEVLDTENGKSLVKVNLFTGRSHQIRVQMKHIGTPVVNDAKYNADNYKKGSKLCLWAYELNFVHPTTKQDMKFKVAPPEFAPWTDFNCAKYI